MQAQSRLSTRIAALEAEGAELEAQAERYSRNQEKRAKEREEALSAPETETEVAR